MTGSTNTEAQVIALALTNQNAALAAAENLPLEAFEDYRLRNLFEGVREALKAGKEPDLVSVPQMAPAIESYPYQQKVSTCIELANSDAHTSRVMNTELPAAILLDSYRRKEYEKALSVSLDKARKEDASFKELVAEHTERLNKIDQVTDKVKGLPEQAEETIKELEAQAEAGGITGLRSGIHTLDKVTGGLQKGQLVIVAGRPGMGKTVLGLNIADYISQGHSVMFFSLEMTATELIKRAVVSRSNLTTNDAFAGSMGPERLKEFRAGAEQFAKQQLIVDEHSYSLTEIAFSIRRKHMQTGARVVVIDYLQLIRGEKGRSDTEQIRDVTRLLKQLAKLLEITIVLLSQLNRDVEQRPRKLPQLSDLKQSGSIEEDANIVIFPYRPEYYGVETFEDNEMSKGLADLIVAKNRNGRTGAVRVKFEGEKARFGDLDKEPTKFHNETKERVISKLDGKDDLPF